MGSILVAEGVEKAAQLQFLKEQGCDQVQGYFYSKTLPEDKFLAWLGAYHRNLYDLR